MQKSALASACAVSLLFASFPLFADVPVTVTYASDMGTCPIPPYEANTIKEAPSNLPTPSASVKIQGVGEKSGFLLFFNKITKNNASVTEQLGNKWFYTYYFSPASLSGAYHISVICQDEHDENPWDHYSNLTQYQNPPLQKDVIVTPATTSLSISVTCGCPSLIKRVPLGRGKKPIYWFDQKNTIAAVTSN